MCLFKVKEEPDYSEPARVREVRRTRRYSPSPPRTSYYSKTKTVEERSPPRSEAPVSTPPPPPSFPAQGNYSNVSQTEYRRSAAASSPSVHNSITVIETQPSRAPSAARPPRSHYVEVDHDDSSDASVSSSDDLRSRTTYKTNRTSHTHKSSKTRATVPASEYSIHEREEEIRRERAYSRPRAEYETYRYVDAPRDVDRSRSSRGYYDPRSSSGSHRRGSQSYYR